jgi:DNA-binding CsgD family transcriptional regulator
MCRHAAAGHQYPDPALTAVESASARHRGDARFVPTGEAAALSDVEESVLGLTAGLHSNEQIGKELSINIDDVGSIKSDAMQIAGLAT